MDIPWIISIETPSLGDRSYLAHDGQVAAVVDPQRDIDRVLDAAAGAGVRITHVFETHIHNDYLTGGLALAQATGAAYHVNREDAVSFARTPIGDGDVIDVTPSMSIGVIATPGHTFTHLSYAPRWQGEPVAVFTGGSLLFGAAGRPDLLGQEHTTALARHQFSSVRRLAKELPATVDVLPTHGFGSFCSVGSTGGATASTVGREREVNPALTSTESDWVAETLAGLDAWPAYYVHMQPGNQAGPPAANLTPPKEADRDTLARRLTDGEWIVDLRSRAAFADGHVRGTFNIGIDGQFATYLGWLIPLGTPLTLLGDSPEQLAEAQRELVRIGVDRLEGAATGSPHDWTHEPLGSHPRAALADLAQVRHHRPVTVLDVRRDDEYAASHLQDAVHIPIHEVLVRLDEVPQGELWVHCGSGYRASIVASLLAARAHHLVLVDDDYDQHAVDAGLPIVTN
ncbi:MBL fold metallo-hydrolase [Segeticoccus rhizosphaerae]|uniref:MBL fold metallo-hydrolase n=1 Tax=Segeticoccus rhizosphaerae TaxID=1104777 RepID=UPI001EE496A0|nr:MBL fold metallo-hydrolase [Ornithinicoccus soli]